jgi:hypothetical protein
MHVALAAGCKSEPPSPANGDGSKPRGVIFVLIDTLRANHLGAYGYGRPTSPHIDAFAAEGTLFENAVTTAPWTLPAMGTIWTSLYPSVHGATTRSNESALQRDPKSFRPLTVLDPSRTTLAEILHANKIRTAGFVDEKQRLKPGPPPRTSGTSSRSMTAVLPIRTIGLGSSSTDFVNDGSMTTPSWS